MKKALIATNEPRNHFDGSQGYRVAQIVNVGEEFPVSEPILYWLDCEDNIESDFYYFDTTVNSILPVPQEVVHTQSPNNTVPVVGVTTL